MVNASEAMFEASSRTTCLRWLTGRPKSECILGYVVNGYVVTITHRYRRIVATYGHEPITLRNGVTRLRLSALTEQATKPDASVGGMPSEAKALGNARDMMTRGG